MPYGQGFGMGRGFGFSGYSPPWPYIGRGRGGQPRCWANTPNDYNEGGSPYAGNPQFGGNPSFGAAGPPEQELAFLKNQAAKLRQQLDYIVARVEDLGKAGKQS